MPKKKRDSKLIDQRQQEQKKQIVDQLRKIPIIQVACEKNGVARATYYRWVDEDKTFASETEEAIREGTAFINDMAESQLITLIKDQNYPAISFWLRNRHKAYADKLRIQADVAVVPPQMSNREAASVEDMLKQMGTRQQSIRNSKKPYVIESKKQPTDEEKETGGTDTTEPTCSPEIGQEQP
jgi:hypothetical protein